MADELKALLDQRLFDDAIAYAEKALAEHNSDRDLLRLIRTTASKTGTLTLHLEALTAERAIRDTPALAKQQARINGRMLETSATWRPLVGGAAEPLKPHSSEQVLHLLKAAAPDRQSGYTMRSKYTVDAQRAAGLEPIAMTALGFPRSIGITDMPATEEVGGVRRIRLDPGPDYDLDKPYDEYLQDYVNAAAPFVRELAPAVLHAHSGHRGYDTVLVALALGRHFGLPVMYEVRGFFESLWTSDVEWSDKSETYRRRLETENRCMADADAVVTLSESMRAEIVSRGIPASKVHVVPNGVDVATFQPSKRRTDLVERYGLADRFVFGYVSNLDHYREGQELLIDAAVSLRRRGIDATAMIVGDGSRREVLERHADELDAGDAVVFTGRVPHDEVLDYYALLDVFVVPRINERAARLVTPLKPLEAMAAGIPVVTSDLEALRELTGAGERGRQFATGDSEALAVVLADLQGDLAARSAMADRARAWVAAERQWSTNGRRYAEIYAALLEADEPW